MCDPGRRRGASIVSESGVWLVLVLVVMVVVTMSVQRGGVSGLEPPTLVSSSSGVDVVEEEYEYGMVIDAGSKGVRIAIYCWSTSKPDPYTRVEFAPPGGKDKPW